MQHQAMLRFVIVDALHIDSHLTEVKRPNLHHVIVVDNILDEPLPPLFESVIREAVQRLVFLQESLVLFIFCFLLCHIV